MSVEYSLEKFRHDVIAISQLERLNPEPEAREALRRSYFRLYGENAEAVGELYAKMIAALAEYRERRRPELAQAMEHTPPSLVAAVFSLVWEKGIEHPTPDQIEMAEANQAPRGQRDFLGSSAN